MKQSDYRVALEWIAERDAFQALNLALAIKRANGGKRVNGPPFTSAMPIIRRLLREGKIERGQGKWAPYRRVLETDAPQQLDTAPLEQLIKAWEQTPKMLRMEFFEYLHEHAGINEVDELVKGTTRHKEYRDVLSRKIDLEFGLDPLLAKPNGKAAP